MVVFFRSTDGSPADLESNVPSSGKVHGQVNPGKSALAQHLEPPEVMHAEARQLVRITSCS